MLHGSTLEATLDVPSNDTITLLRITNELLQKAFKTGIPYKKVGVSVTNLIPESTKQNSLFQDSAPVREKLMQVLDSVNARAGKELVSVGTHLRGKSWQSRTDKGSPAYTTKWTDVAKVKAG